MAEYTAYVQTVNEQDGTITDISITNQPSNDVLSWSSLDPQQWGGPQKVFYYTGFGADSDIWAIQFRTSDGKVYAFKGAGGGENEFRQCNIEPEDADGKIVF